LRIVIPPRELSIFMSRPDGAGEPPQAAAADDESDSESVSMAQRLFSANNRSTATTLVKLPAGGLIGPFNEDSELELVCVAYGGKPRPELSWRRDFTVLNSTTSYAGLDKDITGVALKIPALQREHLLSIFTCQASNNNLTSAIQSSLQLDLNCKCALRLAACQYPLPAPPGACLRPSTLLSHSANTLLFRAPFSQTNHRRYSEAKGGYH
jgi:hypothetical protein